MKGCFSVVIALIVAGLAALVVGGGVCFIGLGISEVGSKIPIINTIGELTMFASLIVAYYIFFKGIITMHREDDAPNHSSQHHQTKQPKSEQDE